MGKNPFSVLHDAQRVPAWGVAALAVVYVVTGWLGLRLPYVGVNITLVWLPTGVAVAALLRGGSRFIPGIYLGAFAVNLVIGSSPWLALAIAVGNTLAPLLTVHWLLRWGFHPTFDRQRDVFLFCLAAAAGMALSASGGVLSLHLAGVLAGADTLAAWWTWWLGDTVGVLLGAPLLLSFSRANLQRVRRLGPEFLVWLWVTCIVVWGVFLRDFHNDGKTLSLAFLTLPLFVWPAMRFGVAGASFASLGISVVAAWGTATGHGTFAQADRHLGLLLLWAYMVIAVLTGLLITALTAERERFLARLQRERDEKQEYFEIASSIIVVIDGDERVKDINRAGCELLGREKADILGGNWFDTFLPTAAREEVRGIFAQLMAGRLEGARRIEGPVLNSRGEVRTIVWHNALLRDDQGRVIGTLSSGQDITERKRYEANLERSRQELRAILDGATDSIVLADKHGIIQSINDAAAQRLGQTAATMIGKDVFSFFPADVAARRRAVADEVLRTGQAQTLEDERAGLSFLSSYCPVFNGTELSGIVAFGVDITARKQAELRTQALLQRSQLLMETATDGIHILNRQGRLVEANDAFCAMLGYDKHEASGLHFSDWDAREPKEMVQAAFDELMASEKPFQFETTHRRKDGTIIEVEVNARSVMLQGELLLYASSRDITARKATERRLAESERRYRLTLDAINEGMWAWDLASGVMSFDARWHEILGLDGSEVGMSREDFLWRVHPDDEALVVKKLEEVSACRDTVVFEFRFRDSLDAWRWLQCRAKVVSWDEEGKARQIVGTHADISRRKSAELELQANKDRLQLLLSSMQDRVLVFDTVGYVTESFDTGDERSPFLPPELFMGRCYEEVFPADVSASFSEAIAGILTDGKPRTFQYSLLMEDGAEQVSMATLSPLMGDSPYPLGYIAVIRDITAMYRVQEEVQHLAETNARLLESLGEGVYGVDPRGNTTFFNSTATAMLGMTAEEVVGKSSHGLFHHHRQDGSPYPLEECPIAQTLRDGRARHSENEWYWHKNGHGFPVSMTVTPLMEDGRSMGAVVAFQDISERKKSEEEIYQLAFFDPLTRLPNRRLLMDRFAQAFSASERHGHCGAVLFIDLDRFKELNDSVGHEAGDQMLQLVAQRLLNSVRSEDTVARLGGDEFVVLLRNLDDDPTAAAEQAGLVAEKIRGELDQPYALNAGSHLSTPSIGVMLFKGRDVAADELLKRADAAMYQAKAAGRNVVRFWSAQS
ncbi:hypothetical protein DLREEDagrD3_18070 [Denitratisoma sp. agr-D3]